MKRFSHRSLVGWIERSDKSRIAACIALLGAGLFIGTALPPSGAVRAEAQSAAQPQHFQSGGQMSVPLLKEIAATLKQMDARLARIETAAQQFRLPRAAQAPVK